MTGTSELHLGHRLFLAFSEQNEDIFQIGVFKQRQKLLFSPFAMSKAIEVAAQNDRHIIAVLTSELAVDLNHRPQFGGPTIAAFGIDALGIQLGLEVHQEKN